MPYEEKIFVRLDELTREDREAKQANGGPTLS